MARDTNGKLLPLCGWCFSLMVIRREALTAWWRFCLGRGELGKRFLPVDGWFVSVMVVCEIFVPCGGGDASLEVLLAGVAAGEWLMLLFGGCPARSVDRVVAFLSW